MAKVKAVSQCCVFSILLLCCLALAEIDLAEVSISGVISWNTSSPDIKSNTLVEASRARLR